MRKFLMLLLLAAVTFGACNKKSEGVTKGGNKYILFKNSGKDAAKLGEDQFARVQIYQYFNDSIMGSTRKMGKAEYVRLPKADEMPGRMPAYLEGLSVLSVGDSIVVFENMDSIKSQIPPQLSWVKTISYHIMMEQVLSKEDRQKMLDGETAKVEAGKAELMKQLPEIETTIATSIAAYKGKTFGDKLKKTASGLEYIVLSEGDGAQVKANDNVEVHYYGALESGVKFDESYSRGQPIPLAVGQGQVIPGWDEGLQLFKKGTKALLFIPFELAYGEQGRPPMIPGKSKLVFYTDIQK
jgi:FKBP-type peptidyl-prolyl cis-trans isomerase FkpA